MMRILVLVLGLVVIAFAVKYELAGTTRTAADAEHTRPRQQLDNVRLKAHQLEQDDQRRNDDLLKKTEEQ